MKFDRILITGGAGFIGSHVVERICREFPESRIAVLDKMTYAADLDNVAAALAPRHRRLHVGDVCDLDLCCRLTRRVDCVIHLAAESHVDNSFGNSLRFTHSNTLGTHTLMEACRINQVPLVLHVSTDEVYGETLDAPFAEESILNPTNPYSASKASAEMLVNSYRYSFGLPVIIVRGNNIFGARQYPEKIIPKFILQSLVGDPLTIHGDGSNRRHYLAVEDFAEALVRLLHQGSTGEIYNIGTLDEHTNLEVARMICAHFDRDPGQWITFVADRPFNDARYAVDFSKIQKLGWDPTTRLDSRIAVLVQWYREHLFRYEEAMETWRRNGWTG